ncbi:aminopeptidase N [Arthrobacter stackebrandtii]|uniref:Aminopeptidase N n=1 Tax=Arthrobacter stackebrandtii TaxID=272161 RepID=A0ABS4YZP5_9MICC|nr:aminopeptidase N [Arthrobacter stackebrandtii]MBP2414281.1 aminopeptidase N [Arthrobacter stackebrandtii]PYH01817.1 aminopeptidase N [Arthrobacter stackebrandtii]
MPGLNLTRAEAVERSATLTVSHYDVALDLTTSEKTFSSTTTVTFSAREGSSSFIDAVTHKVHRVTLNGVELDPAAVSDGVRIQLPDLAAENELRVEADSYFMNTGEGLHRFVDPVDGEVYLYTQFEVPDSRRMFAVFEQPDQKATFTFHVTAPAHWDVISNSPTPAPEAAADGTATWHFEPTLRMSSYITALIAGPYASVRSELTSSDGRTIPLGVFARKSLMEFMNAEDVFEVTRQGFEFYEAQFGVPYPFPKYDQLFVPEFNAGAMENAGAVTFLESYVFRTKPTASMVEARAMTVLHELAHMWFGDLVTMRWWNDLWLNESFATFMSALAAVENTRYTGSWTSFALGQKVNAYRADQLPSTHPVTANITDLEDVLVNFDAITYGKGASVLRQLVAWVGQEEFMAGIRSYFAKHAWGNTELPDLMVELEAASGRDLTAWTEKWLETAGVNTFTPAVEVDDDGAITSFSILQTAVAEHPVLRPHRAAVGFYNLAAGGEDAGKLVRTHRIELDVDGAVTEVPELVGLQRPALILLNDDDLAYAKIRLDAHSLATATAHLKDIKDSLPRTLVASAAWDAMRDGETPARGFVDLVLNNVATESESSVISGLLRQLATTIQFYVAADAKAAAGVATADRLWELASAAGAGSDAQLQFLKAFATFAQSPGQLATAAALLDGSRTLDGLAINQDLRWDLLVSLAAGGAIDASAVDAELERDSTQNGTLLATEAKAAIPTADAKAATWESVVVRGDLANAAARAAITGFNRVWNTSLLEPYVATYFGAIQELWEEKGYETSSKVIVGLFPSHIVAQSTIDAADTFLARLGADHPALRRLILENRDGVVRALRARTADA